MKNAKQNNYDWLCGVVVPMVTPLAEGEKLDEIALRRIISEQVDAGVHALFVLGSVGEGPMMDSRMRRRVIELTVEAVRERIPVLAGASDNSVVLVLKRLKEMAEMGVKAGVCTLPYYGWYDNPASAIEFFTSVADASPIPIIVYNLPRVVGASIKPETTRRLYHHPNIAGIKDTDTDIRAMEAIASDPGRPHKFKYLFGNSSLAYKLFKAGADGIVCAPANVMPNLCVALYQNYCRGNMEVARKLSDFLSELCKIFRHPTTCGGIKVALELQGICSRRTIRPWPQAGSQDREEVKKILNKVHRMYLGILEEQK